MIRLQIPQPVKLGFDPAGVTDPELRAVIEHPLAWLIWLLWRPSHIVSQYFNASCLGIAKRIEDKKPDSIAEMCVCFRGPDFPYGNVQEWMPEAYLYLIGTLTLRVEVLLRTNDAASDATGAPKETKMSTNPNSPAGAAQEGA